MFFARRYPNNFYSSARSGCRRSTRCHPYWQTPSYYSQVYVLRPSTNDDDETSPTKKDGADASSPKQSLIYRDHSIRIYENEPNFTISIDLPGVKFDDINAQVLDQGILQVKAERKVGDKVTNKFSKQFPLDDASVDLNGIQASYKDGVLVIDLPKKNNEDEPVKPETKNVSIDASSAPTDKETVLSTDLAGIKLEDVKVLYRDGILSVQAERRHGDVTTKTINFAVPVNTKKIDTTQLAGFLANGVLTVVGPKREPVAPMVIAINGDQAAIQKDEDLPVAQQVHDEDEIAVFAETVSEEEATSDEQVASVMSPSTPTTTSSKEEGDWENVEKNQD